MSLDPSQLCSTSDVIDQTARWNAISERVLARLRRAVWPTTPPRARPEIALHQAAFFVLSLFGSFHPIPAVAHNAVREPSLGDLILKEELIVRGTVTEATRAESGFRVAVLHVDKVLKGTVEEHEIRFVSDPDHGVRYAAGERVLLFLTRTSTSAAQRRTTPFVSPQVFSMKYPLTSFDPSGYDGLVTGLLEVAKTPERAARRTHLKELLVAQLDSHERKVRLYAAEALRSIVERGRDWNDDDRKHLLAYISSEKSDPEVRQVLRAISAE